MLLKNKVVSGVKWTTVSSITLTATNILKISVLARFLDKSDFGLMAIVTFVLGFMNLFMDMGLTSAILHKQNTTPKEYASLFWINLFFSLIIFLLIWLLSPLISSFYNEQELSTLIPIMGVSIILSALGRQFKTIEQKNFNFKYLATTDISGAIVGMALGVFLAYLGYGVYSLVFGTLANHILTNLTYFLKGIYKRGILFHLSYLEAKPFLRIGVFSVGGQIVNYFNRDFDVLLIGKVFGVEVLGGYSLAKQLAMRPMSIINPIVLKVGMSFFPKFQNDHSALRKYFLQLYTAMGSLNAFVYGLMAIYAHQIVLILYGQDFLSIVLYLQLFTIIYYFRSVGQNVSILIITTGRTDHDFYWNLITTLMIPLVVFLGSLHSVVLVIVLMGFLRLILLVPGWYIFYNKLINLPLVPYLKAYILPLAIAIPIIVTNQVLIKGFLFWQIISSILLSGLLFVYTIYNFDNYKNLFTKYIIKKNQV